MKYKMTFSYDGTNFKGFQRQNDCQTVQGEIEKVLSNINEKHVDITSCGRTDTGVHAKKSVVHFELDKKVKPYNLTKALNKSLNGDIYVFNIEAVNDNFHARYDCIEKEYRYFINIGDYNIFERNYTYQYNKKLNINKMRRVLKILEGEHDFRSLCTDQKEKENCVRTILKTTITKKRNIIEIKIIGTGFLKHMVRNIVGVLIEIGSDKFSVNQMKDLLNEKSREKAIKPVPSCGLYLWDVKYK